MADIGLAWLAFVTALCAAWLVKRAMELFR